jgi:hypothetical protein
MYSGQPYIYIPANPIYILANPIYIPANPIYFLANPIYIFWPTLVTCRSKVLDHMSPWQNASLGVCESLSWAKRSSFQFCLQVLDRGLVAQCGSHNELLESGGLYANMWARQVTFPTAPKAAVGILFVSLHQ